MTTTLSGSASRKMGKRCISFNGQMSCPAQIPKLRKAPGMQHTEVRLLPRLLLAMQQHSQLRIYCKLQGDQELRDSRCVSS
mmetsp:Transcript_134191/g.261344  ORF Transcript_134191/g.261344 Transcript_134191/m.261344 type:complete len:81 (-) Transcript_134191:1212-1454(-)